MAQRQCRWMSRAGFLLFTFVLLAGLCTSPAIAGFRFRLAFTYVDGFQDLVDQYEDNLEREFGVNVDDASIWPVGISLFPYYQWDNGIMAGAGIGPFIYIYGDADHWQLPVSFNIGYVVGPDNPVSFYVRGGPSYHFADGDYHDGSNLGLVGAIGLEFLESSHFRMGVEAAYDSAEVDIDTWPSGTKGIKAAEFSVGLFLLFK